MRVQAKIIVGWSLGFWDEIANINDNENNLIKILGVHLTG
jgi:hypothetical protein